MIEENQLKIDVIEDSNRLLFLPEGGNVASTALSSMWFGQLTCNFNLKRKSEEADIEIGMIWSGGMDSSPFFSGLRELFGHKAYPVRDEYDRDWHRELLASPLAAGDQLTATFQHDNTARTLQSFVNCHKGIVGLLERANLPNNSQPTANGIPVIDLTEFRRDALPYYRKNYRPTTTDAQVMASIRLPII